MSEPLKSIEELKPQDIQTYPVWEYVNDHKTGETIVTPVTETPVRSLRGRVIGTKIQFSNGGAAWAVLENIDSSKAHLNEHFLTLSIWHDGAWFTLSRYFDADYREKGPHSLAECLRLDIDQVFPIAYDLSPYALGNPDALVGIIFKGSRLKLSQAALMDVAAK